MSTIEGYPALLFEELPGVEIRHLDFSFGDIVPVLARIHTVQLEQPIVLDSDFHFDDACMIWLPLFHHYRFDTSVDSELSSVLNRLAPLVDALNAGEGREALFSRSPAVHCHGDVAPRNILLDDAGVARLIDFNNAFFGPRLVDVIDGAFNFSGGNEAYFDAFVDYYRQASPLSDEEAADLPEWIALVGIMRLTKQLKILMSLREQQRYSRYLKRFRRVSAILLKYL